MKSQRPARFEILVCYDVNTLDSPGRSRLRKVAKACEAYGQRVQFSVFECALSDVLLEKLRARLLGIINPNEDSLRIYYLYGPREKWLEKIGRDGWVDFLGPLVV